MKDKLKNLRMSAKKKSKLGFFSLLVLTAIMLLTIENLEKPKEIRNQAAGNARIFFQPTSSASSPIQKNVNETFSIQLMIDPGQSMVSFIKFEILYDQSKLEISSANNVVINSDVFPVIFEGPVLAPGKAAASISVGNDPTKAFSTRSQIATITFKALANTNGTVQIQASNLTQALSIGAEQTATDNVIATREPAFVAIGPFTPPTIDPNAPSPTIMPSATNAPTVTSGPSPTGSNSLPTIPQGPTATLSPSRTTLALNLRLHGIGSGGDSVNPNKSSLSNKNPLNQERNLNIQIVNEENEIVATKIAPAFYNSDTGIFFSNVVINDPLPQGDYVVKVKADAYLRKLMPGFLTVEPGEKNIMKLTDLIAGDINNDNVINALDYNTLYDCGYGVLKPYPMINARSAYKTKACQSHDNKENADLNNNGVVEASDYNLFIRELSVQFGD